MFLQSAPKKTNRFITYSLYGVQSHVIVNNCGVAFTCNTKAIVYESEADAYIAKDMFYNQVAEIQTIIEVKSYKTFPETTINLPNT